MESGDEQSADTTRSPGPAGSGPSENTAASGERTPGPDGPETAALAPDASTREATVAGESGEPSEPDGTGDSHETAHDGDEPGDTGESAGTREPSAAAPDPVGGRGRRNRGAATVRITARTLVALLSVLALGITGYAYNTLDRLQSSVHTTDALRADDAVSPAEPGLRPGPAPGPAPPEDDGATDILLVGTDSRTDMSGNPLPAHLLRKLRTENKPGASTDTIIVLRIPENGDSPTGISIPRDSWVDVPHGGKDKINSVYARAKRHARTRLRADGRSGGAALERKSDQAGRRALVGTVQDLARVHIDHYAEVNLLGFYLLTEALGGVEVCLDHPTTDPDSGANFRAGRQTVSGGEALSFVRQRKNLPRGDLDRIVRQQAFLASALNKVLSAGTLTDPGRLDKLTETVRRSLVLDSDMDLLEFAERVRGIASGDISFVTIPVNDINARSPDGTQSIVRIDVSEVRTFVGSVVANETAQLPTSGGGSAPVAPVPRQITADEVPCVN